MIPLALSVFCGSLFFIVALFGLKLRELRSGKVVFSSFKRAADHEALRVKELLFAAKLDLRKTVPLTMYWTQMMLHRSAIGFARFARVASYKAHQLADFVSHKRNFQPSQTRSEFLKKMSSWKRDPQLDRMEKTE